LGCLISGFKKFTYPNIIKPLLTLPFLLYLFGMIESIIVMCTKLTVFIGSQHTQKTVSIHHFIHNTFTHFPLMHLHWEEPLNFMIGASPFIIVFCILCIIYKENFCLTTITSHIKKDFLTCCYTSASFFTFLCLYFYAFEHTSNKAILMALNQLSIPLTLLFSFIVLKEKILLPQKVATVLIIAGGMIAAF
ncbi:MAG: putative membrane protein, partial [Alteromonas naphthalenivorans]